MIIPLHQLPTAGYPPEHPICWHPHKTWAELQGAAAGIASQVSGLADKPWLLALDSGFYFAAALLACWQQGITPIIAPDTQPGTIQQLQAVIAGIITDRQLTHVDMLTVSPSVSDSLPVWEARAPQDRALDLFTSGSTGMRKRIPKTFAQLAHELTVLHQQKALHALRRFLIYISMGSCSDCSGLCAAEISLLTVAPCIGKKSSVTSPPVRQRLFRLPRILSICLRWPRKLVMIGGMS
jgi:acyl-coenzyme A synthetase/AMP-(fatty) acid ligase